MPAMLQEGVSLSTTGTPQDGIYARIPISDITIAEASDQVDDPAFWSETMPAILFHFSVGDYWALTVADHRALYDYLVKRGLVDGDE